MISICLCTYHRPKLLADCLRSLLTLQSPIKFEVIVVDNDSSRSAFKTVDDLAESFEALGITLRYAVEPTQGIASARNLAVLLAEGTYVAFIDDDETAAPLWLEQLYKTLTTYRADAVWGPVLPVFPEGFPDWQKSFFTRDRWSTGEAMTSKTKGTGNVLIKRECLQERSGPFDSALNQVGGSDSDLFNWLERRGKNFVWCNEALVYEIQPLARTKIRWHLIRAYRGGWGFAHRKVKDIGRERALFLIIVWVVPAIFKNFLCCFNSKDIREFFLNFLKTTVTQFGKLGFFFKIKIYEYKK